MKGVISFLLDIQAGKAVIRSRSLSLVSRIRLTRCRILVTVDSVVSALRAAGVIVTGVEEHGDPTKTYTRPAAR
jgi:S-adenosylhomocysteine hydrolase